MKTFFTLLTLLSITYVANAQLSITYETVTTTCPDGCDGKIKITGASGGTAPYTLNLPGYSQSITNYNGTDTVYFDNLCGNQLYTVEISDATQLTTAYQSNISVPSPAAIQHTVTLTNVTCPGSCNGSAQITITNGGTPPYQFVLNGDTNTTGLYTNLCAEYFYPYITDANGCEIYDASFNITEPETLSVNTNGITQPSTCNSQDGMLSVNVYGGTAPYTYLWSNNVTDSVINNIGTGIYHLTVTDANGCTEISHLTLNPFNSSLTISAYQPTCFGQSNGKIMVLDFIPAGTEPFYLTWTDGTNILMQDTLLTQGSAADTLMNLPTGDYYLTISDNSGSCHLYAYTHLSQPDSISIYESSINNVQCHGQSDGYISIYGGGGNDNGQGYSYLWSNNSTSPNLYNIVAGTYTVTVSDFMGCSNTASYVITEPDTFTANVTPVDISCYGYNDGYLLVTPHGGTPPYYYILNSANNYSQLVNDTVWVTQWGIYSIFIKDNNYCDTLAFNNLIINEPPLLLLNVYVTDPTCLNNDGSIMVSASGGTGSYSYLLNNDSTTDTISNLSAGTYSLTIYDENSCETDTLLTLSLSSQLPVIKGNVLFNQIAVDSSKVLLFVSGQYGAAQMDTLDYVDSSFFNFTDLMPGSYFLKANYFGQSLNAQNTYYNEKLFWTDADTINVGCDDTLNADIHLISIPVTTGTGYISGYVRFVNPGIKAASEPVPGAEIAVEQVPGPTMVKMALTDSTGFYNLSDLPELSNCNLRVDIPGLPMLSTYTGLSLSASTSDSLTNMNFLVDTATNGGIMIDTILWTNSLYNSPAKIIISPNPVLSQSNVDVYLNNAENVNIKIINVQGNTVYTYSPQTFEKGKNSFIIQKNQIPSSGIYYLVVQTQKYSYIKKFIKQ